MTFFHVTRAENLSDIMRGGLVPSIGARSQAAKERHPAVFLFSSRDAMEDALMNWLGEEFGRLTSLFRGISTCTRTPLLVLRRFVTSASARNIFNISTRHENTPAHFGGPGFCYSVAGIVGFFFSQMETITPATIRVPNPQIDRSRMLSCPRNIDRKPFPESL